MDILFVILLFVGAILALGTNIVRLYLEGVALIDFVSAEDAIVYGIMMMLMAMMLFWWIYAARHNKRYKPIANLTSVGAGLVVLAYLVLLTSIWGDSWLLSYANWCTAHNTALTYVSIVGWMMVIGALGWFAHKLYVAFTGRLDGDVHNPVSDSMETVNYSGDNQNPVSSHMEDLEYEFEDNLGDPVNQGSAE